MQNNNFKSMIPVKHKRWAESLSTSGNGVKSNNLFELEEQRLKEQNLEMRNRMLSINSNKEPQPYMGNQPDSNIYREFPYLDAIDSENGLNVGNMASSSNFNMQRTSRFRRGQMDAQQSQFNGNMPISKQ